MTAIEGATAIIGNFSISLQSAKTSRPRATVLGQAICNDVKSPWFHSPILKLYLRFNGVGQTLMLFFMIPYPVLGHSPIFI
jgi:hypothetical protein